MTAATPGRELLARTELARVIKAAMTGAHTGKILSPEEIDFAEIYDRDFLAAADALLVRLAAKPADEGVREQAAKLLETRAEGFSGRLSHAIFSGNLVAEELRSNANVIRALSTTGESKR